MTVIEHICQKCLGPEFKDSHGPYTHFRGDRYEFLEKGTCGRCGRTWGIYERVKEAHDE